MGTPKAAASSAIQAAQLASMFGWRCHSALSQAAKAHSSSCTATGLAFEAVQALSARLTYTPMVLTLSSAPAWLDTPAAGLAKNEPRLSMVLEPSVVWMTMSRTAGPP